MKSIYSEDVYYAFNIYDKYIKIAEDKNEPIVSFNELLKSFKLRAGKFASYLDSLRKMEKYLPFKTFLLNTYGNSYEKYFSNVIGKDFSFGKETFEKWFNQCQKVLSKEEYAGLINTLDEVSSDKEPLTIQRLEEIYR